MRLFRFSSDEIIGAVPELKGATLKCGCCNWESSEYFWLADSEKQAHEEMQRVIKGGGFPLCGTCMAQMLSECTYEIKG